MEMNIERIKAFNEMISASLSLHSNSKDGLTTYSEDSEADHGDGQQVGRETTCVAIIKICADKISKSV